MSDTDHLARLDHRHVWHPFTPMQQWREQTPLIVERAEGPYLIDTEGNRYIDGVSSLWCNLHGHRVPQIDQAILDQLGRVAHTTLLGLASPPSIALAARLARLAPGRLARVFYSECGATAVEAALKMAVGYWHHRGRPRRHRFIALAGAYHGDTTGSMAVGYSDAFHRPFRPMLFPTAFFPAPDPCRPPPALAAALPDDRWPSECPELGEALKVHCLAELDRMLRRGADDTAAVVLEPGVQGAAGMICQPPGFAGGVAELARRHGVLLIADEVATGFTRTGAMFACDHEGVEPDLMCLAKGLSGGYLPLAATVATEDVEQAFTGPVAAGRTLFHGHTYTGNALACAAALASLDLIEHTRLLDHVRAGAALMARRLTALRDCDHVLDVRQRGLMAGIELCRDRRRREPLDPRLRTGAAICMAMRPKGLLVRPLGDVIVLMPVPAMPHACLHRMLDVVIETVREWGKKARRH